MKACSGYRTVSIRAQWRHLLLWQRSQQKKF
jgi:hypothetical protein